RRHAKEVRAVATGIEKGSLHNAIMPYLEDKMRQLNFFIRISPLSHGGQRKTERISWALQGRMEHGKITLNPGPWTKKFTTQLLDFPNPLVHDDTLDALAYIDQISVNTYGAAFNTSEGP